MGSTARSTYALDLKNGLIGVLASCLAAGIIYLIPRLPPSSAIICLTIAIPAVIFLTRRGRRLQISIAKVISEPSSSKSAQKSLQLFLALLRNDRVKTEDVQGAIELITRYRRHPHTALCVPLLTHLRVLSPEGRRSATAYCRLAMSEMRSAHHRVTDEVAEFIRTCPPSSVLVLYGFSRTVCAGLAALSNIPNPIWVIEDKQYGDASINEHLLTFRRLQEAGHSPVLLPYPSLLAALGSDHRDVVEDISGNSVTVPGAGDFIAVIGCDAIDDEGTALIPAIADGRTSESAKFVEIFDPNRGGKHKLFIATECYKMIERSSDELLATSSPITTPLWVSFLHQLGLAVPFRGRMVRLVAVKSEISGLITDRGVITAPFSADTLRRYRKDWAALLRQSRSTSGETAPLGSATVAADSLSGITAVLLDFNGVLFHDEPLHFEAFCETVREASGKTLTWRQYEQYCLGRTDSEGISQLVKAGMLNGPVDWLVLRKQELYTEAFDNYERFLDLIDSGAKSFVERCRREKVAIHIVTASEVQAVEPILRELALDEAPVLAGVRYAQRPRVISELIQRLEIQPQEVLVIDDSESNVDLAYSLGCQVRLLQTRQVGATPSQFRTVASLAEV